MTKLGGHSQSPSTIGDLPALPEGWHWTTMGEVADVVGGGTPNTKDASLWGGGIPWVTPADLSGYTDKTIAGGARTLSPKGLAGSGARMLPAGTVLMSSRAPVGYVAIAACELSTNQGFKSFVLQPCLDPNFVYWYLKANRDLLMRFASGTTFPEISGRRAAAIPVPVPSLMEQRAIVEVLEEHLSLVDSGASSIQRALVNTRRLRAATLRAAVDGTLLASTGGPPRIRGPESWLPEVPSHWTFRTVADLAELLEYGTSAKTSGESGIPVLRMGNIVDGELDWTSLKYLPADHTDFPNLLLREGDVLFNRTNSPELVGKTAVYRKDDPQASFASYLLRVRLKPGMLPEFFSAFVNSSYGRSWVASVVSQQVGQANVNGTKLRALRVPCPPLDEQVQILAAVEDCLGPLSRLRGTLALQRVRATRLRQSILQAAFSGNLSNAYAESL